MNGFIEQLPLHSYEEEVDHTKVVILNCRGDDEDVEMYFEDDGTVAIRQFNIDTGMFDLIVMTPKMFSSMRHVIDTITL